MMLAALPWFRQGWMADPLRKALLETQSAEDRATTRDALAALAFTVVDASEAEPDGRVTVARVASPPRDWQIHWADWRAGLPRTLPERDMLLETVVGRQYPRFGRREFLVIIGAIILGLLGAWAGVLIRSRILQSNQGGQPKTP
jgi:hypothetical protein